MSVRLVAPPSQTSSSHVSDGVTESQPPPLPPPPRQQEGPGGSIQTDRQAFMNIKGLNGPPVLAGSSP